jgi:hypothetical protein
VKFIVLAFIQPLQVFTQELQSDKSNVVDHPTVDHEAITGFGLAELILLSQVNSKLVTLEFQLHVTDHPLNTA